MAPRYTSRLLKNIQSHAQLHEWELRSDDIYDETAEVWPIVIRKAFPRLIVELDYVPKHRKSWHKVYDLYKKINDENIAADTQKMVQKIAADDEQRQSRLVTVVSSEKYKNLQPHRGKTGWAAPKKDNKSFFSKARKTLRFESARFKISAPSGTNTNQIKTVPQSFRDARRIASQPDRLDVNGRRLLELERAAEADQRKALHREEMEQHIDQQKALQRQEMEQRARQAVAPAPKEKLNYTIVGNVVSFHDDEDDDLVINPTEGDDDLFGDDLSPEDSTPTKSSAKRARDDSIDSAALDRPAKRLRGPSEEPTPASTSKAVLPKRRRKGLSAAPGANSAESTSLRLKLLKDSAKRVPPTTTKAPSSTTPSASSDCPRTPPHQQTPSEEGDDDDDDWRSVVTDGEKINNRWLRHKDGSLTPQKEQWIHHKKGLAPQAVPDIMVQRRIMVCRPPVKLK